MNTDDDFDQIERLFRLRESGALTNHEFEAEKSRVLNRGRMNQQDGLSPVVEHDVRVEPISRYSDTTNNRRALGIALVLVVIAGVAFGLWLWRSQATGYGPPSMSPSDVASIASQTNGVSRGAAPSPHSLSNDAPHVGMVVEASAPGIYHRDFGGWKLMGGQVCGNGDNNCAISLFKRNDGLIFAHEKIVRAIKTEKIERYIIQSILKVDEMSPQEIAPQSCIIKGNVAIFASVNLKSSTIRGVVFSGNQVIEVSVPFNGWIDSNARLSADGTCERSQGEE